MRLLDKTVFAALAMALAFSLPAAAQPAQVAAQPGLPLPSAGMAKDVPGAKELPDPNLMYKIVFNDPTATKKPGTVNQGLLAIGHLYNTLVHYGVPADHIDFAVVLHRGTTNSILKDEFYKPRHNGADNPDLAMIKEMTKVGIKFHVCGQAVLAAKIDPKWITPEVELDLWALTTLTNFRLRGYIEQNV